MILLSSRNPLRILLVIDSLDIGGAEQHVLDLAEELRRRGHDVTIACGAPIGDVSGAAPIPVLALLDHSVKRTLSLPYARALHRLITSNRFDLVHAHLYASAAASALAIAGTGVPLVVTEHTEGRWQDAHARSIARWYLHRAAHVLAVSHGIERRVRTELTVQRERLTVIPNAIPIALGSSSAGHPALARSPHRRVAVVARLCAEKGVDLYLDAVARIAHAYPDVCFLVVGDGPLRSTLQMQAFHLGLHGRVSFCGEVRNARQLMRDLDVLVVPSRTEGTPLVVLEALTQGVPVIATRTGGMPEQIHDGIDGLLVPVGDADALAAALNRLLSDRSLQSRMAAAARQRQPSQQHARMVDRIEEVYWAVGWCSRQGRSHELSISTHCPDSADSAIAHSTSSTWKATLTEAR